MENNWRDTSWSEADNEKVITITEVIDYLGDDDDVLLDVLELSQQLPPLPVTRRRTEERVAAASLEHPIIVVVKGRGKYQFVLDGNHRLQKAINEKVESIRAKILDLDNPEIPEAFKKIFEGA